MSDAGPPQGANGAPSGGSAAATAASVGVVHNLGTSTLPFAERGRIPAVFTRSFHGLTWKRIGIFCLIPFLGTIGAVVQPLWQEKGGIEAALTFLPLYGQFFLGFAPGLLAIIAADNWLPRQISGRSLLLMAAFALGALLGALLMYVVGFPGFQENVGSLRVAAGLWVGVGFVAAIAAISYVFVLRTDEAHSTMHQERMDRIRIDRELTEARLQVLQARVEPQFLFNTLAQVERLYETEPNRADRMLDDLIVYLRAALPELRKTTSTVAKEVALARAYLNIAGIRLGDRLESAIEVPDDALDLRFPPMVLLPLIDHAIAAGTVESSSRKTIGIEAAVEGAKLRLVIHYGAELTLEDNARNPSLQAIRDRLQELYGNDGRIDLRTSSDADMQITLEIPCERG